MLAAGTSTRGDDAMSAEVVSVASIEDLHYRQGSLQCVLIFLHRHASWSRSKAPHRGRSATPNDQWPEL